MCQTSAMGSFLIKTDLATAATECMTSQQHSLMHHNGYQLIVSKLLGHQSLPCSAILEINPITMSVLLACATLSFVNRGAGWGLEGPCKVIVRGRRPLSLSLVYFYFPMIWLPGNQRARGLVANTLWQFLNCHTSFSYLTVQVHVP